MVAGGLMGIGSMGFGQTTVPLMVDTNGVVQAPTNFFATNANAMAAVLTNLNPTVTLTNGSANIQLGQPTADTNAGMIVFMDLPVTSAAAGGTVQSYELDLNGTNVATLFGQANGGGGVTNGQLKVTHLAGQTNLVGAPTVAVGAGAGTGAAVTVSGSDLLMQVSLTTGSGCTSNSAQATITYAQPFGSAPLLIYSAANTNAAWLGGITNVVLSATTTGITLNAGWSPLAASTTYKWNILSGGAQ